MSAPIDRSNLEHRFWERKQINELSRKEWDALCDSCGKCCLHKLEDADTGEIALTRIACRLFDSATCSCAHYACRRQIVPDCIKLRPDTIAKHATWLPATCAYRLVWEGSPLPDWHPLVCGNPDMVHSVGISVRGLTLSEISVPEFEWENHIIKEPR